MFNCTQANLALFKFQIVAIYTIVFVPAIDHFHDRRYLVIIIIMFICISVCLSNVEIGVKPKNKQKSSCI